MALMDSRTAVVFGVANKRSIAWGITQALAAHGARLALAYQNERLAGPVAKLADELSPRPFLAECDVTDESSVTTFFAGLQRELGHIDALVHSIATAKGEELGGHFADTSWEGYQLAQQVSAYSLVALARQALPLMEGRQASIVCLTYYGAEKVVPNYNVMGVAKAALESCTRYLAADLGPQGIRVNAISAGPIKTLSAKGVSGFDSLHSAMAERAPLRRNVTPEDVGKTAVYLLSDLSSGVTGQTIYVDAGYSIMGA